MKKHNLINHIQGNASNSGLLISPDGSGYTVNWPELPSSDHFFLATGCHLKREATGIKILFGSSSSFDDLEDSSDRYDLAVEIHFPIQEAKQYLHKSIFFEMSSNGKNSFFDSIKESFEILKVDVTSLQPVKSKKLPLNRTAALRIFPANFAAVSFAGTQALVEFFEVTPELIHFVMKGNKLRPSSSVKPVISIILDSVTMYNFLEECRALLGDIPSQESNI